jgi:hypothetical protein
LSNADRIARSRSDSGGEAEPLNPLQLVVV